MFVCTMIATLCLGRLAAPSDAEDAAEKAFNTAMSNAIFRVKSSEECLKMFEDLAKKYPDSPKATQTEQMIKTLKRNVAEERDRPKTWLRVERSSSTRKIRLRICFIGYAIAPM